MYDFDWLIHPFARSDFVADVWQNAPTLLATGRSRHFDGFFGPAELERVLEYGQPKPPTIRLASSASNTKVEVPVMADGRLDIDRLRRHYVMGQTVIVNNVEDFDPNVATLIQSLQAAFSARAQVNAYATPPSAQGFKPHYDTHDVIVLQIEGEKRWRIHGRDSACPLNELTDGDPPPKPGVEPPTEMRLVAGDVLYIPRGWVHEAETTTSASLHLTVGIHAPLGKDLLVAALECACRANPRFREVLPFGFASGDDPASALEVEFGALLRLFTETASAELAVGVVEGELRRRGRSGGDGQLFCDMNRLGAIDANTVLVRRPTLPCRLFDTEDGMTLQFAGSRVQGPKEFGPAMAYVMACRDPFQVGSLPGIGQDHQIALATSLVVDGLCRFDDRAWNPASVGTAPGGTDDVGLESDQARGRPTAKAERPRSP